MPHYTQEQLDEAEERRARKEEKEESKRLRKQAKKIGVSTKFLRSCQHWIQEGREPTIEEFTNWARCQHKRACKRYQAAYPLNYHNGKCRHMLTLKRPCVSFFSHTGICETGYFVPERIRYITWTNFQKSARKAARIVKKELGG